MLLFFFVFALCFLCFFDRTNDGLAYLFMKSGNPDAYWRIRGGSSGRGLSVLEGERGVRHVEE